MAIKNIFTPIEICLINFRTQKNFNKHIFYNKLLHSKQLSKKERKLYKHFKQAFKKISHREMILAILYNDEKQQYDKRDRITYDRQ